MKTGFAAMRLGSIIYFIPFFFVLEPALILAGEPIQIMVVLASAVVGVLLIAASTQGYLLGFGALGTSAIDRIARVLLFFGGLMFAFPGSDDMGIGHWDAVIIGLVLATVGLVAAKLSRKVAPGAT